MSLRRIALGLAVAGAFTAGCSASSGGGPVAVTAVTADPNAGFETASYNACSQAWRSGTLGLNESISHFATLYAITAARQEADPAKWQAAYDGCARGLATFLYRQ